MGLSYTADKSTFKTWVESLDARQLGEQVEKELAALRKVEWHGKKPKYVNTIAGKKLLLA